MDNFGIFIDNLTFQHALVLANFIMVGVTIVLVVVTWLYTRQTKRMADIMNKDFELRITPQYDIEFEHDRPDQNTQYVGGYVNIRNTGLNTVYVKNKRLFVEEIKKGLVKDTKISEKLGLAILKPEDEYDYRVHADAKLIAITPPVKDDIFFGIVCNIIFTCEVAGPSQDFKVERLTIEP